MKLLISKIILTRWIYEASIPILPFSDGMFGLLFTFILLWIAKQRVIISVGIDRAELVRGVYRKTIISLYGVIAWQTQCGGRGIIVIASKKLVNYLLTEQSN